MNTIEDELRQLLADPPHPPRSGADAVDRVRAGVRRRRRHRAAMVGVGTLTVTMLAAGVVVGTLLRGPAHRPEPVAPSPTLTAPTPDASAIPWRDLPSVEYPEPSWPPRPAATPCRAADLAFEGIDSGAAMGTTDTSIRFRNAGSARCTLSGRPTVIGRNSRTGATVTVPVETSTMFEPRPDQVPATIDPGETAQVNVETHGGCLDGRPETRYGPLRLRLPHGEGELRTSTTINGTCGVGLTVWHRPAALDTSIERLGKLSVSIEAPRTVAVGTALDFVVALHNDTGEDIPLSPCPNYLMYLRAIKVSGGSHQLNCAVSAVPAHGQVRFAMRLDLPASPDLVGEQTVEWMLDANGPDGSPVATAGFTVTP
jgi:hypothetical protein